MRTFNHKSVRFWAWAKRHMKLGALLGIAAAIACHYLPANYKTVCDAVASCLP